MTQTRRIPNIPNAALSALATASLLWGLFAIPLLLTQSGLWSWSLVLVSILTPFHWALLHEAFHHQLFANRKANEFCGRMLCIFFGSPLRILRFGHLMHHRFNRSEHERTEVTADSVPSFRFRIAFYLRLVGGLFIVEALSAFTALLPRRTCQRIVETVFGSSDTPEGLGRPAAHKLLSNAGLREIRVDGLTIIALHGAAFYLYGEHWWMLAAALMVRAFLISVLDNAYHYGTELNQVLHGLNLSAPKPVQMVMLNFNLHGVHHLYPALSWRDLPAAFSANNHSYDTSLLAATARQFRGPIVEADLKAKST